MLFSRFAWEFPTEEAERVGLPVGLVTYVYSLRAPAREFARVDSEFSMAGKISLVKMRAKSNIDETKTIDIDREYFTIGP